MLIFLVLLASSQKKHKNIALTLLGPAFKNYVKGQGGGKNLPPLKNGLRADFGIFFLILSLKHI